jgi:AraC-like DNA-binding protein
MDALSAVLRYLRLESAGYRRFELRSPWAIGFSQAHLRGIHVVLHGRCELVANGGAVTPLAAGDLVILPRADAHVLRSVDPSARIVDSMALVGETREGTIHHGGDGEAARVLCGAFLFLEADAAMLEALPHIIRIGGHATERWLGGYVDVLATEARDNEAGSEIVMARLSDALIARALRYLSDSGEARGWLSGLRDPQLSRALGAMHSDIGGQWSLPSLAQHAGMSRAGFAARFAEVVGQSPMLYLTELRMRHAMRLLANGDRSLAQIAEAVGYGSEAAFATAFKRHTNEPPGAYRRKGRDSPRSRGVEPHSAL